MLAAAALAMTLNVSETARQFLARNGADFEKYEPSYCSLADVPAGYGDLSDRYSAPGDAAQRFAEFVGRSPKAAWDAPSSFELMYDRTTRTVYDRSAQEFPPFREGQVILLSLDILPGYSIPVAFEFVRIDAQARVVEFSYLTNNKSKGVQRIEFEQEGTRTVATHRSRFGSDSAFRDKWLYAPFHRLLTDAFWARAGYRAEPAPPR